MKFNNPLKAFIFIILLLGVSFVSSESSIVWEEGDGSVSETPFQENMFSFWYERLWDKFLISALERLEAGSFSLVDTPVLTGGSGGGSQENFNTSQFITNTGEINLANPFTSDDSLALANSMGSGLIDGGIISIGSDSSKFDVSSIKAWFVNNSDSSPNLEYVECSAFDEVTVENIASVFRTDVSILRNCTLVQKISPYTNSERRSHIVLGRLVHADNVDINVVVNLQHYSLGVYDQYLDLTHSIGNINPSGNVYTPSGANLHLDRSEGTIFRIGSNYAIDKDNPNEMTQNAETNVSFFYRYQDGSGGFSQSSTSLNNVDVGMYDDGSGTLASVSSNRFSVHRVYLFSDNATVLQYGQATYNKLSEASASIMTESFIEDPNLGADAVLRGWIVVRGNTADLTDLSKVMIVTAGRFGSLAGGSGTSSAQEVDLQNAYNNSAEEPEIVLNDVGNDFSIWDSVIGLGVKLFSISNGDGTEDYFNVSESGVYAHNFTSKGNITFDSLCFNPPTCTSYMRHNGTGVLMVSG